MNLHDEQDISIAELLSHTAIASTRSERLKGTPWFGIFGTIVFE